jgi:hypothetical protein
MKDTPLPTDPPPAANAGGVALDTPVQRNGQTITHVAIRKPSSGELRGVSLFALLQMDVSALQTVLPRITVPMLVKAEIEALEPSDLLKLGSEVSNFLLPKADRTADSPTA